MITWRPSRPRPKAWSQFPASTAASTQATGGFSPKTSSASNLRVHYRWLEDPPNQRWLLKQALSKLTRLERRNRARVEAEKSRVLAERDAMWKRLADLTAIATSDLASKRRTIQKRIERIAEDVARRNATSDETAPEAAVSGEPPLFERLWQAFAQSLTTPPRREEREPIVVREELDYHTVVDDVPLAVRAAIEAHPRLFPGVRIGSTSRRVYYETALRPTWSARGHPSPTKTSSAASPNGRQRFKRQ